MKKTLILTPIAALSMFLTGCDKTSATAIHTASYGIGVSTALVANQIKTSDVEKTTIIEIVTQISTAIPETNSTFSVTWTPIADKYLTELVNNGKIDEASKTNITLLFSTAVETLEHFIYKRHPVVKTNVDLANVATHGFCDGFLSFYNVSNLMKTTIDEKTTYDKEAYDYCMKLVKDKDLL